MDSQPPSLELLDVRDALPLTKRSKSSGVAPLVVSNVVPVTPPKPKKSSFVVDVEVVVPLVTANSCSFFVCSSSTLRDNDLISSMNF